MYSAFKTFFKASKKIVNETIDTTVNVVDKTVETAVDVVDETVKTTVDVVDKTVEVTEDCYQFTKDVANDSYTIANDVVDATAEGIYEAVESGKKTLEDVASEMEHDLDELKSEVNRVKNFAGILSNMDELKTDVSNLFQPFISSNELQDLISEISQKVDIDSIKNADTSKLAPLEKHIEESAMIKSLQSNADFKKMSNKHSSDSSANENATVNLILFIEAALVKNMMFGVHIGIGINNLSLHISFFIGTGLGLEASGSVEVGIIYDWGGDFVNKSFGWVHVGAFLPPPEPFGGHLNLIYDDNLEKLSGIGISAGIGMGGGAGYSICGNGMLRFKNE